MEDPASGYEIEIKGGGSHQLSEFFCRSLKHLIEESRYPSYVSGGRMIRAHLSELGKDAEGVRACVAAKVICGFDVSETVDANAERRVKLERQARAKGVSVNFIANASSEDLISVLATLKK